MKTYYSASSGGFYRDDVHDPESIPEDALELVGGDDEWQMLLNGLAQNKRIVADEDGYPTLEDNPPPTIEEISEMVRQERNLKLKESDWSQLSDVPESLKEAWKPYRQSLRDLPEQDGFPYDVKWPEEPK